MAAPEDTTTTQQTAAPAASDSQSADTGQSAIDYKAEFEKLQTSNKDLLGRIDKVDENNK